MPPSAKEIRILILWLMACACVATVSYGATVSGTIRTGSTPTVVANARVTVFDPALSFFREARTNSLGQYNFANVPSGTWRLGACSLGLEYSETAIIVGANAVQFHFTLAAESNQGQWNIIGNT